jgi:hypothetical protein
MISHSNSWKRCKQVGRETINSSDDQILRHEMPSSLQRVNGASKLLEEACAMLKADPYSQPARKKLIEGARGDYSYHHIKLHLIKTFVALCCEMRLVRG